MIEGRLKLNTVEGEGRQFVAETGISDYTKGSPKGLW